MRNDFHLLPGEELHTLIENELYILQRQDQFRFGIDAVLLANWVKVRRSDKVVDLGTGSGVIPLILAYKRKPQQVIGIEIQKQMAQMAKRSVILNDFENLVEILHWDLRRIKEVMPPNRCTLVVSNPPYFPLGRGKLNPNDAKAVARHEVYCTLSDLIEAAAYLLGTRGRFAFVHRAERIPEIFQQLTARGMEAKLMRLIQPRINQSPNLVLIEAVKGAKPGIKIEPNLVIYDQSGNYTSEVIEMYYGTGGGSVER
ncbi:hypothetical protein BBF96_14095 [Anoxybacter fermentans]|uniref:Methyltransferase small domain-containing protein n=1 Tax=Anoxybacter fermentans TaxID=1323375 RepID=A0A3Q9HU59_9FIRM|nr:tRNA1(Val) (adenine(37)-N6)-methyltransferase [Anoxybacter fermentans]AZR74419.1 hypothetical protein BBF96_14095 [Anoxybacter fermentans]